MFIGRIRMNRFFTAFFHIAHAVNCCKVITKRKLIISADRSSRLSGSKNFDPLMSYKATLLSTSSLLFSMILKGEEGMGLMKTGENTLICKNWHVVPVGVNLQGVRRTGERDCFWKLGSRTRGCEHEIMCTIVPYRARILS